jgi:hypothetical protein
MRRPRRQDVDKFAAAHPSSARRRRRRQWSIVVQRVSPGGRRVVRPPCYTVAPPADRPRLKQRIASRALTVGMRRAGACVAAPLPSGVLEPASDGLIGLREEIAAGIQAAGAQASTYAKSCETRGLTCLDAVGPVSLERYCGVVLRTGPSPGIEGEWTPDSAVSFYSTISKNPRAHPVQQPRS